MNIGVAHRTERPQARRHGARAVFALGFLLLCVFGCQCGWDNFDELNQSSSRVRGHEGGREVTLGEGEPLVFDLEIDQTPRDGRTLRGQLVALVNGVQVEHIAAPTQRDVLPTSPPTLVTEVVSRGDDQRTRLTVVLPYERFLGGDTHVVRLALLPYPAPDSPEVYLGDESRDSFALPLPLSLYAERVVLTPTVAMPTPDDTVVEAALEGPVMHPWDGERGWRFDVNNILTPLEVEPDADGVTRVAQDTLTLNHYTWRGRSPPPSNAETLRAMVFRDGVAQPELSALLRLPSLGQVGVAPIFKRELEVQLSPGMNRFQVLSWGEQERVGHSNVLRVERVMP